MNTPTSASSSDDVCVVPTMADPAATIDAVMRAMAVLAR